MRSRPRADCCARVTDSPWTQRALDYNTRYGEIYATPAHFYVITRRYREAIELLQRAVEIEPDLYSAHAELGINLLRENKIAEAQQHLADRVSRRSVQRADREHVAPDRQLRQVRRVTHIRAESGEGDGARRGRTRA